MVDSADSSLREQLEGDLYLHARCNPAACEQKRQLGWLNQAWPHIAAGLAAARADEREKIEKLRGDVHHNLNSSIGLMRWKLEGSEYAEYFERVIIPRLYATTDAADAALGERPMRDQLADMQRDIALARSAGVEPKEQQT